MTEIKAPPKTYRIYLNMPEMQAISNSMTALFNRMAAEKKCVSPEVAERIYSALYKMKVASEADEILIVPS